MLESTLQIFYSRSQWNYNKHAYINFAKKMYAMHVPALRIFYHVLFDSAQKVYISYCNKSCHQQICGLSSLFVDTSPIDDLVWQRLLLTA